MFLSLALALALGAYFQCHVTLLSYFKGQPHHNKRSYG
jgi:hypothetical protein